MQSLRDKLFGTTRFLVAAELVSVRGSMAEGSAIKIRTFLPTNSLRVMTSIGYRLPTTQGGNPQLAPLALGRPILYAGMEVVLHLTCRT